MSGQRPDGVDGLGYHDGLVVDHVGVEQFGSLHPQHVSPQPDFVKAVVRPAAVCHQFLDHVRRDQARVTPQQRDPTGTGEGCANFIFGGCAGQIDRPVVDVRDRHRHRHGHGHYVEFGIDAARVGALVAGDRRLRKDRVHEAAEVALPGVSGAPQQRAARALEQAGPLERAQRANDRGSVTGHHTGGIATNGRGIVHFGNERMACDLVLFSTVQDEALAGRAIAFGVAGADPLRGAINHDVAYVQQVVQ
ncbi:hypothetical protein D9M73_120250 [compost metagenome]